MIAITYVYAVILIAIGVTFYAITGSGTSLIASGFGLVVFGLAVGAGRDSLRKHMMHGAALVALLGVLGNAGATLDLPALLSGEEVEGYYAVISRSLMAVVSVVYLGFSINSFVAARRARKGAG